MALAGVCTVHRTRTLVPVCPMCGRARRCAQKCAQRRATRGDSGGEPPQRINDLGAWSPPESSLKAIVVPVAEGSNPSTHPKRLNNLSRLTLAPAGPLPSRGVGRLSGLPRRGWRSTLGDFSARGKAREAAMSLTVSDLPIMSQDLGFGVLAPHKEDSGVLSASPTSYRRTERRS